VVLSFFFQAEDGIRDFHVTGVQTCALPIWKGWPVTLPGILASRLHADGSHESILRTPGQVCGGNVTGHPFLTMDGQAVFKLAVEIGRAACRDRVECQGGRVELEIRHSRISR